MTLAYSEGARVELDGVIRAGLSIGFHATRCDARDISKIMDEQMDDAADTPGIDRLGNLGLCIDGCEQVGFDSPAH